MPASGILLLLRLDINRIGRAAWKCVKSAVPPPKLAHPDCFFEEFAVRSRFFTLFSFVVLVVNTGPPAAALDTVFTEEFSDAANWLAGDFAALNELPSGGPDGSSYVSVDAAFDDIGQGTIFRGEAAFGASGGAFVGDWIDEGYAELSMWVRHNAPAPVGYFTRIASPRNFPGAGVVSFAPVLPNTWTKVKFNVLASSPQFVTFEDTDYNSVLSNIGNIQFAVEAPAGFEMDSTTYSFDLDKVSIDVIPEPASLAMAVVAFGAVVALRRTR